MLTEKQQQVFDSIHEFIARYAKSPTLDELMTITHQKSKRGVVQYLEVLEKKWFITRGDGHRGIKLGNGLGFQTTLNIPILGFANAWKPLVEAVEHNYGVLPISKKIITGNGSEYFILKVEGTSMNQFEVNGKLIDNGSYVLIRKDKTELNTRDAFLFIVDGAATIKKYRKEWEYIYLIPQSKEEYHHPIILSQDDKVMVNGKVVDVFSF
jgi:SOS-response transcriptional repressor LexA